MELPAVLRAYAALAPEPRAPAVDVTDAGPLLWRGTATPALAGAAVTVPGDATARRLAGLDELHHDERLLREGWLFACGPWRDGEVERRVCLPLLAAPVRLTSRGLLGGFAVQQAGDRAVLPLVGDPSAAAALESAAPVAGPAEAPAAAAVAEWVAAVLAAAGLPPAALAAGDTDPVAARRGDDLVVVAGSGLYVARDVYAPDLRTALRSWAASPGLDHTAFAATVRGIPDQPEDPEPVASPLPLTAAQRRVVARSRHAPVTVVSGPPGSGKSHTVVALAVDAVARGESVLLATSSVHAADVLADLLDRQPGPAPVLFGDAERRAALADHLSEPPPGDATAAAAARRRRQEAADRVGWLERALTGRLEAERMAGEADRWESLLPVLLEIAPGALDPDAALDRLEGWHAAADVAATGGWWDRLRSRWAERRLRAATRAAADAPLAEIGRAVRAARARRTAGRLVAGGGTAVAALASELVAADAALRDAVGQDLEHAAFAARAADRHARRAVADLAAVLRASRGVRRERLRGVDGPALVGALPLWIGTLGDIEDLLPPVPGLFDLVVLDEASQIDQLRAAPALVRGRRGVVAGDPRQLRHVSFVADSDVDDVLARHGLADVRARLDVRRVSAFDLAAGAAPVQWLTDHHRCVPHLIGFSARRFYPGRMRLLTRHPTTEQVDAIVVRRVRGRRDGDGVNAAEVAAAVEEVMVLRDAGATSIGVVTPFRAQADALEQALLERFDVEVIAAAGLRVGTVHAFQGGERDHMVASLALAGDDPEASRRFVEDSHLFNVLITRARQRMTVVTSLPDDTPGLLGEYLAWSQTPPAPVSGGTPPGPWATVVAAELERLGVPCRPAYPVGEWAVDLCVGAGDRAAAAETGVHPDGPAAHLERARTLLSVGWRLVDAFPTRWDGEAVAAALALARDVDAAG